MTKAKKITKVIPGDKKSATTPIQAKGNKISHKKSPSSAPRPKHKRRAPDDSKESRRTTEASPFPTPRHLQTQPYWKELNKVIDPELNMGIIDLGLIYAVEIKNNNAHVKMTLTSPACPVGPFILQQVEDRMRLYKDIKSVQIEIVWDPVWTQEMIDPDIRDLMFGF